MSKAEDLAKRLYPDPRMEDYDDILVYRADRYNASMGRINVVRVYEQAEEDLTPLIEAATIVYEAWNGGTMDDVRSGMVELGKRIMEVKK